MRHDEAYARDGEEGGAGPDGGDEGEVVDAHERVGPVADDPDGGVGAGRAEDADQGDDDGHHALRGRDLVQVAWAGGGGGGAGVNVVVDPAEDALRVGDEDDADQGHEAGGELLAGERLAEEDGACPGRDYGDEEAEDGRLG